MNIKEIHVGQRVGYRDFMLDMPVGFGGDGDTTRRGTVTKVGRKYVTLDLDKGIYGGSCRRMIGSVTMTQQVLPEMLFPIND